MDIEDIINNNNDENIINYVKDLAYKEYKNRDEYDKEIIKLRKKYKLCLKKMQIRNNIKYLDKNKISKSFLNFSLKKIGKSSSGVTVITVLTDPFPEYTKDGKKVKQSFSCGHDCSYCPNEPELKINLKIINIFGESNKYIRVVSDIDLNYIRVINYVTKINDDEKIIVEDCMHFTDNEFTIKINGHNFNINDKLIGIKIAQPRSYISSEPAVLRANRNRFDALLQMHDRANVLNLMGHPIDKIEIIVLGGTWDHYPLEYRLEFIRDLYYSMNIFNGPYHERQSLEKEIKYNQNADSRIIGITTETRPDTITVRNIKNLRKMNITRVQLGVQHIDDDVLEFINRGCYTKDTINANYILKQNGYKVDMHFMPDLPGSSYEKDINMFEKIFSHKKYKISDNYYKYVLDYPELQADQLKIYPCSTVPFTKIKEWYDNGEYVPYSEDKEKLIEVILKVKLNVFPWIRLNRIIRDIPLNWINGGNKDVNLRQYILSHMKKNNMTCNCIRCREVSYKQCNIEDAILVTREYNGLNSTEYFISFESTDYKTIHGFVRLRINNTNDKLFNKSLNDSAFIRELHVYGKLCKHGIKGENIQHMGFGKKLMMKAESIVKLHKINKINVISGVGVREYYKKLGYSLCDKTQYMYKIIDTDNDDIIIDNNKIMDNKELYIILSINIIMICLLINYYYTNLYTIITNYL